MRPSLSYREPLLVLLFVVVGLAWVAKLNSLAGRGGDRPGDSARVTKELAESGTGLSTMIRKVGAEMTRDVVTYAVLDEHNKPLSQWSVYSLMAEASAKGHKFRQDMATVLREQPMPSYFWETPSITRMGAATKPFEFVVVRATGLDAAEPEPYTFAEHFPTPCSIAKFSNLGGDTILIAPTPCQDKDFAHLARFVRNASAKQQDDLFKSVGETVLAHISEKPIWVSTSGAGVAWLHVRLDNRPKYYTYDPFRTF